LIALVIVASLHWMVGYSYESWYKWFTAAAVGLPILGLLNQWGIFDHHAEMRYRIKEVNERLAAIEGNLKNQSDERGRRQAVTDATVQNWKQRAENGDPDSQFSFGLHNAVAGRAAEAASWYKKSAEQGHAYAQHYLGIAYANSEGVPHDDAEAYFWLSLSATSWDKAKEGRDSLAQRLTATKRTEIDQRCQKWLETHRQGICMVPQQAIKS
jgi:hypothetical protein